MRTTRKVGRSALTAALLTVAAVHCKHSSPSTIDAAPSASTFAAPTPSEPSPPTPPIDAVEQHRSDMEKAANDGRYDEVCAGTPSVPRAICDWVGARARGTSAPHPGGPALQAFFVREHIKRASGTLVGEGNTKGEYEVIVGGYRRHCLLETEDTTFETTGYFTMWVQESPKTETVDLKAGGEQQWVVLEESSFAKAVMDLAHSPNNAEGKGIAEDLMGMIARFVPYAELEGSAAVPDAAAPAADAAPPSTQASATSSGTPVVDINALPHAPPAAPTVPAAPRGPTRTDCIKKCVASCADDSSCERTCVAKCPAS